MSETLLVIEDEIEVSDLLTSELESEGFKVIVARNGKEGLEKIQKFEPDLIICDRIMPVMSGEDLLQRLRGVYPQYTGVPFIFLTALGGQKHMQDVMHLDYTAYIEKPLDFDILLRTVRKALS